MVAKRRGKWTQGEREEEKVRRVEKRKVCNERRENTREENERGEAMGYHDQRGKEEDDEREDGVIKRRERNQGEGRGKRMDEKRGKMGGWMERVRAESQASKSQQRVWTGGHVGPWQQISSPPFPRLADRL
ncbi:Hypothetical predicted protein [Xyrichtys novacula]|uniref:Uncharacterized protein n=1 Tax=Xyrichtys novacula TaxID=13765 RepID=A0AAV1GL95_XYRNO|nr:Hypothetical predicted protein [Xyrichtys novacula]